MARVAPNRGLLQDRNVCKRSATPPAAFSAGRIRGWENQSFIPPRPSAADGSSAPGGDARWSGKEIPKTPRKGTEGGWHGSPWTATARNTIEAKAAGETFSAKQGSKISSGATSRNTALSAGTGARSNASHAEIAVLECESTKSQRSTARANDRSASDSSRPQSRFG